MRARFALAAFVLLCIPALASAQDDAEGSKDHPIVSRFPGYYIDDYDAQDFSAFDFPTAQDATKRVEGRYWRIVYWLKDGAKKGGPIEIGRNYSDLFTQRGGAKLFEDLSAGGGMLTSRMPAGGKNIWLNVDISNAGEVYTLTIVEEAGLTQQVEFTSTELARILNEKGSVALHGILFDTGQATIKPESEPVLTQIGDVLKTDAAMRLEIRGHTDNVGAQAANQRLSEARAAAVKTYLVSKLSVAPDRLTTAGFGDTQPVGDNRTDEGRTQNRRVELVKK